MAERFSDSVVTDDPVLDRRVTGGHGAGRRPSISTAQMRQAPVGETFCSQQRVGMVIPDCRQPLRESSSPSATVTFLPSIVRQTIMHLKIRNGARLKGIGRSRLSALSQIVLYGHHGDSVAAQTPFRLADCLLVGETELDLAIVLVGWPAPCHGLRPGAHAARNRARPHFHSCHRPQDS